MKRPIRFLILALACVLFLGAAVLAAGNSYTKEITASYSGISLVVDGIPVVPKDANGNVVEPFIYEGTTYLPVRAVGEALGKTVSWDGATRTVYVGQKPGEVQYLLDVCPPYDIHDPYYKGYFYKAPNSFTMMGKEYRHGFALSSIPNLYVLFNLNGEYSSLEFDFGPVGDTCTMGASFEIYLDGEYYDTITGDPDMIVTHIAIPLDGTLQMKIMKRDYHAASSNSFYGFANAILS